ncbi:hypothetical protein KTG68_03265 [Acinetobacter variabilis]|uniref:Uncharacterized protein n=2 Tax=Acinetobacter variabilis TaxID=70346 RepID=N9PA08_9GAMM|nr:MULTISPECIES: hypothetical protein [Acinetobacter]HCL60663.1 hypothetical protein [Acinetobacter sp.]AUX90848.1 hypothetical protein C3F22_14160 [Acinetobacter sp. ACNIH1]ENU99890.1 hypothetical protein F969_00791 [Acinetobacter variabilis]ENX11652.1 hypothetical protein F897_00505 [Acinetobacter variabilis]MBO3659799.1 hypothetical protein [Acinetobacter variabilis]
MTDLNNITVTTLEDGMVSLLVDQQPISEKYGMKFDASIVDDIQALENGQKLKLFDQFVFSHTDLNFEHSYHYVTGIEKLDDRYQVAKHFVYRIKIEGQPEIEHVISNQGKAMTAEDVRTFIQAHVQKSLSDYTDLNYAY